MGAPSYDLQINQYANFGITFVWLTTPNPGIVGAQPTPVDLTGYTAMMQIKPSPRTNTIFYDASENIVLGGTSGTVALNIPGSATGGFTWWQGVYDILLISALGVVTRFLQGSVSVSPGVTP